MKSMKQWLVVWLHLWVLTSFSQKCGLAYFKYDQDALGAGQYTFLSSCSEPCLVLEKRQNGVVFFCPGAHLSSKIKKEIQSHKQAKIEGHFFDVTQEKLPVFGVKILLGIESEKSFLLARTFMSVNGQQGLLIRCMDQKFLNTLHDKTASKIRRYAYCRQH